MKFYHYSAQSGLFDIVTGNRGLVPRRRFIPLGPGSNGLPDKAIEPALFGLLEPMDKKWCSAIYIPGEPLIETVLGGVSDDKLSLLEITLAVSDDVYVADHAPHLRKEYNGHKGENVKVTKRVKKNYWNSLVPLAKYLKQNLAYQVPEVICFSAIPLKRLRIIETFEKEKLINNFRIEGGFLPHPTRSEPDEAQREKLFNQTFGF